MDARLPYRATVLREWQGSESHDLVHAMLQELHATRMNHLLAEGKERFDQNLGHLLGLTEALRLVEQTLLDEGRQRPQEVSHGLS